MTEASKKPITAHLVINVGKPDEKKIGISTHSDLTLECFKITRSTKRARIRPDNSVWSDGVLVGKLTGVLPKKTIKAVLDALRQLEGWYCR